MKTLNIFQNQVYEDRGSISVILTKKDKFERNYDLFSVNYLSVERVPL